MIVILLHVRCTGIFIFSGDDNDYSGSQQGRNSSGASFEDDDSERSGHSTRRVQEGMMQISALKLSASDLERNAALAVSSSAWDNGYTFFETHARDISNHKPTIAVLAWHFYYRRSVQRQQENLRMGGTHSWPIAATMVRVYVCVCVYLLSINFR